MHLLPISGEDLKIRHIGIAVDSIEDRLPVWESSLKLSHTEELNPKV